MNNVKMVDDLNERLADLVKKPSQRIEDAGDDLLPGQLWVPAGDMGETPSWLILVVELLDNGLFNGVPVFRWSELSGPNDVYVPAELAGSTLLASFELKSTLAQDALSQCAGRLANDAVDFVRSAMRVADDESGRQAYSWGRAYFGIHCGRLEYHETINAQLEPLQHSVRTIVYEAEDNAAVSKVIEFPLSACWSAVERDFEYELMVGDDGTPLSACVIRYCSMSGPVVNERAAMIQTKAVCESFDTLVAGSDEEICCEWFVKFEDAYVAIRGAALFAVGIEEPIGEPLVQRENDGLHLVLTRHHLPEGARSVARPEALKLVVYVTQAGGKG